jgi:Immunoglobulin I-set domain
LGVCCLAELAPAQVMQLQPLTTFGPNGNGSILPGQLPYLTDGSTNSVTGSSGIHELQRSMAYNPTTGHLLVLSRTNIDTGASYYIAIIDANSGVDLGSLSLGTPGFGANANFDFDTIAIGADGGIYVGDLTSDSQTTGAFNLYYWQNESAAMNYVWSGDPSSGIPSATGGNNQRWGDSITVMGTGTNTQVLLSSRGNVAAILTPTDPTLTAAWALTTLEITNLPNGESIGYGLSYGTANNTFYAQGTGGPLFLCSYNTNAGTAAILQTYGTTNFPELTGAIAVQSQSNLLAGLEMPGGLAANVRLYSISNTAIVPILLDRQVWVTNEDGDGIYAGSIFFGGTNLYALTSDNGIMAFGLVSGPQPLVPPAIILDPVNVAAYFQGAASFTAAADGVPAPNLQWYFNTNTVITYGTSSTLTVSNLAPANLGLYSLVATNSSGSVTSSPAILSQAIAFENGVVYDPFNYSVGSELFNQGGWVTNTAPAANQLPGSYIAAGNLGVPGLAAPIGNHYLWSSNVTVRLPFGTITNGPLYFSFSLRATNISGVLSTEDALAGLAYYSSTTLYPKIDCIWSDQNDYQIGIAKGTGTSHIVTNSAVFNDNDIVFIVGCLVLTNGNTTGQDPIELWVNPDPSTYGDPSPPAPSCMTTNGSGDPTTGVDRFSWRGSSISIQHEVDELRIGFTWAAVTPPPPVSLAAGLSGGNFVVSWPTNGVGWNLMETTNLLTGPWTLIAPIIVQGTNNTFTQSGGPGQEFFQLTR